jgi:hypothetical protein
MTLLNGLFDFFHIFPYTNVNYQISKALDR